LLEARRPPVIAPRASRNGAVTASPGHELTRPRRAARDRRGSARRALRRSPRRSTANCAGNCFSFNAAMRFPRPAALLLSVGLLVAVSASLPIMASANNRKPSPAAAVPRDGFAVRSFCVKPRRLRKPVLLKVNLSTRRTVRCPYMMYPPPGRAAAVLDACRSATTRRSDTMRSAGIVLFRRGRFSRRWSAAILTAVAHDRMCRSPFGPKMAQALRPPRPRARLPAHQALNGCDTLPWSASGSFFWPACSRRVAGILCHP
jgi:hypothetical protein